MVIKNILTLCTKIFNVIIIIIYDIKRFYFYHTYIGEIAKLKRREKWYSIQSQNWNAKAFKTIKIQKMIASKKKRKKENYINQLWPIQFSNILKRSLIFSIKITTSSISLYFEARDIKRILIKCILYSIFHRSLTQYYICQVVKTVDLRTKESRAQFPLSPLGSLIELG